MYSKFCSLFCPNLVRVALPAAGYGSIRETFMPHSMRDEGGEALRLRPTHPGVATPQVLRGKNLV
jgi:hypothetical protein